MRILLCTEFYHDQGGGYAFALDSQRLLEAHGHEVIPFAARHPDNHPTPYAGHFVPYEDLMDIVRRRDWRHAPAALMRLISNREAATALRKVIERYKPDLVHTHIIASYLTQSVWVAAKDAGLPVVHTLHDYKLLCPDTSLLCHGDVCEACKGGRFYQCLLRRCKAGSAAASTAGAAQAYANALLRRADRCVDAFVAPSVFIARKHVEWGMRRIKVHHIPNFTDLSRAAPHRPGSYFLYLGRLSREKGLHVLVEAARRRLYSQFAVAGDGPLRATIHAEAPPNVSLLGNVPREDVPDLLARCRALIVPSIWYENASLSVLEALAAGAPVIGSRIGGLPEQIDDGANGLLVEPGDAQALADAIDRMDEPTAESMGHAARAKAETAYSPTAHYERLMSLYGRLISPK